MNKSELTNEQIERINFAVQLGLDVQDWEPISLLSGGLTGIPVLKINVQGKPYVIKLEDINNENFDLVRNYKIVETISKQGISPKVYLTDPGRGVILMEYIEAKQRPQASPLTIKEFASFVRTLHDKNSFSKWKSVIEIMNDLYQELPAEYKQNSIIKKCMQEIKKMDSVLFDSNDVKSCHCDLNPANVLFNGEKYFLVDWQAASPQSFYFDLACCATWFYFYSEDFCTLFLESYLDRKAAKEEQAKFYLMRILVSIYYGIAFVSLPLKVDHTFKPLNDEDIKNLPSYLSFLQSIGSGQINLNHAGTQQRLGFIFFKTAETMMNEKYHQSYEYLIEKNV